MPDVGIRELKTHASEIVRNVRENRARYVITYRGVRWACCFPWRKHLRHRPRSEASRGPPSGRR